MPHAIAGYGGLWSDGWAGVEREAGKGGGRAQPLDLTQTLDVAQAKARELVALDDALNALAEVDPRKSRIVELRFFGGLSVKETAEVAASSRLEKISRKKISGDASSRGCFAP